MMSALALGKNLPVKVIDIRKLPLKHSDPFDPSPPATREARAENFNRWFEGSKVVDSSGDPMIMYHGTQTSRGHIEQFNPEKVKEKSGGSRDFVSLTDSPKFATNWAGPNPAEDAPVVYPVYVSAKNPGDFRNPKHVAETAEWAVREELKVHFSLTDNGLEKELANNVNMQEKRRYMLEDYRSRAASGIWTFWENPKMWNHFGWDGAFMKENVGDSALNFAAPNPSQIKSVFNKGFWSEDDPRILYSAGAPLPLDLESIEHDPFDLEEVPGDPFAGEEKK